MSGRRLRGQSRRGGSGGYLRGSAAGVVRRRVNFVNPTGPTRNRRTAIKYTHTTRAGVRKYKLKPGQKAYYSPVGGATSNSKCIIKHRSKPLSTAMLMKRVGAPNTYIYQRAIQFIANQGFQNAYPFSWNQLGDLITMQNATPNNLTTPVGSNLKTNRYHLANMTGEMLLTNSSLATAYVEIYDLVVKRDSPQFSTQFTTTLYDLANPLNCWIQGVADLTNTTPNLNVWETIKSLPFDSGLFNQYFKVIKRHHVNMPQGSTHRHTVNLDINRLIDGELLQAVTGADNGAPNGQNLYRNLKGITMYSLVVAYGQPASIPQEAPATAIVTTSRVAIDVVQSLRYKYQWVQDTTRTGFFVDNLSTLTGEQVISAGAGQIVANAIV